jgi:hypothetical protein
MDFTNRAQSGDSGGQSVPVNTARHSSKAHKRDMWSRLGIMVALISVVVLLVGIILLIASNNNDNRDNESKYILGNKLQAVFLNTGQVYFGNVKVLNNNFLVLTNIFYLQTASSSSTAAASSTSSNVTLVKLGCELHMPYDEMVINRSQVTFWENLQSNGQVSKAVSTWENEHPDGQKCTDQSSSSANTSANVQNAPAK